MRTLTKNLVTHLYTFSTNRTFWSNTYLQLTNLPQLTYSSNSWNGCKQITLEVGFVSCMGSPNHWPLNEASRSHRCGDFLWCLGGWCMDCHRWCGALVLSPRNLGKTPRDAGDRLKMWSHPGGHWTCEWENMAVAQNYVNPEWMLGRGSNIIKYLFSYTYMCTFGGIMMK